MSLQPSLHRRAPWEEAAHLRSGRLDLEGDGLRIWVRELEGPLDMGREGSYRGGVSTAAVRARRDDVLGNPRVLLGLRLSDIAGGRRGLLLRVQSCIHHCLVWDLEVTRSIQP